MATLQQPLNLAQSGQKQNSDAIALPAIASEFWDTHEILFIDNINKPWQSIVTVTLSIAFQGGNSKKRLNMKKKKVLSYTKTRSMKTLAKIYELHFEFHSPDGAPHELLPVRRLQKNAGMKSVESEWRVVELETYFAAEDKSLYRVIF